MHAKVPLSLGVEPPLELLVLGIVGSAVRDDENRLQGTEREGRGEKGCRNRVRNRVRNDKRRLRGLTQTQRDTEPSKVRELVTKLWNNAAPHRLPALL